MSHRGNESGMDFEWNNRTGPMDGRSPFAHVSQNAQRFPAGTPSGKRSPQKSHNSPAKFPAMSNSPTKPLPPTPAYNGLFSTPRKSNNNTDYDDSSAGETPKSPEEKTPDTMGRSMLSNANETMEKSMFTKQLQPWDGNMGPTQAGAERSPTKEKEKPQAPARRESWMVRLKNRINSPGRGEIARADHEKRISKKSRSRELQRHVSKRRRHSVSDSEGDDERKSRRERKDKKGDSSEKKPHWISSTFTFIAQHPTVPHILSFYAQLIFNVFLLAGCAYLIYCFWSAVSGDVDKKSHEAMADIMAEMAACAEQYTTNKCDRATRAPALETVCENWSKCMNRDPSKVGRARVSAHTFAEIFNSFVEPISWKAMIFTFLLVFGCFATTNMAFGFFRDKTSNANQYYHHQQPPPFYPPPTPQRSFSGQNPDGGQQYYGTPWSHVPALEPQPSGGAFAQIEGRGSPVRRLVYN